MKIRIETIKYENFKGFKAFEFSPDGQDATIRGENGVGKTTGYDGWLWLLFGKDSDGRADFNVRPLDENNEPIKGVIVAIEGRLRINDEVHTLRKEQHEKIVKGQIKGYEAVCSIDEVPKKVGEFQEYIESLCPEELFRQLTDLSYFNSKMHNAARRKVLLEFAGKLPKPAGFEALLSNLNGRKPEDYEKVLKDRKKAYDKERTEINPRIDELQLSVDEYVQTDSNRKLEEQRDAIQKTIDALNGQRDKLLQQEKQRQETIDKINHLTCERLHRESQLKNDTSSRTRLFDEKAQLESDCSDKNVKLAELELNIREYDITIEGIDNEIAQKQVILENIRTEMKEIDKPDCPTCGQKWPQDKPKPGQADITKRAKEQRDAIERLIENKKELQDKLGKLRADENIKTEEYESAKDIKDKCIAEIDEVLKNKLQVDLATDEKWQALTADIEKLQKELGAPVAEQLEIIETNVKAAQEKLQQVSTQLAQADNFKKARKRIAELDNREKELAQLIADCEDQIEQIKRYRLLESQMIESAVNDRFKYVEFKLFGYYLNGEINDQVCEAIYRGVPYPDMSKGQKKFCDVDITNTLAYHYNIDIPLFIDDAADLTLPLFINRQMIILTASFVYKCVACHKPSYRNFNPKKEEDVPEMVACDYCSANAKRYKQLDVQVEVAKEAGKAVAV